MSIEFMFFAAGFVIGAFVSIFVCSICWYQKKMTKYRKPKKSTITPRFAKRELKMNVVKTAIQRDRLILEDSDQVYEYAAKKLLRQIASTIREQLMDNIEVSSDYKTNCMILEFTFWTRRPRQKVRDRRIEEMGRTLGENE